MNAESIIAFRKKYKMTQVALAVKCGVCPASVAAAEQGYIPAGVRAKIQAVIKAIEAQGGATPGA